MGSAASSEAKKTLQNHVRATVLEGKPLDASDIRVRYLDIYVPRMKRIIRD